MVSRQTVSKVVNLSPREREIVSLLSMGHKFSAVASLLKCSSHTVNEHMRRVRLKLGTSSTLATCVMVAVSCDYREKGNLRSSGRNNKRK